MKHLVSVKLPLGLLFAFAAVACAGSRASAPAGVPVSALVADKLTLRGVAHPTLASATCGAGEGSAKPAHVLELQEDTHAALLLELPARAASIPPARLNVTHLASNRSWCVMTQPDGSAVLGADFPSGLYTVSVAEAVGVAPREYELRVQKL
jgi:hypothetical protein